MPLYRYYFFDVDGGVRDTRAIENRNDSVAVERAHHFLANQIENIAVEIWRGQGFVKGVRRDGSTYGSRPRPVRPSLF